MAEQDLLRQEFHQQTAQIHWHELQPHYARGAVVLVAPGVDLVEAAMQLRLDNKAAFERWIAEGKISAVGDELGRELLQRNPLVWAVVVAPWVLVQQADEG